MSSSTFGINAMLADMEPLLRRITARGIDIAWQQGAGLWQVRFPSGRLEEVLFALCVDACEAMDDAGTLQITTANVRDPAGIAPGEYVRLSVRDTARTAGRLVAALAEGASVPAARSLQLASTFVKSIGGALELEPAPGRGLAVHLFLPRAPQQPGSAEAGRAPATARRPATILLVEDDRLVMNVAGQILTRLGYSLLLAPSAEAALRQMEQHQGTIDLLLTDIQLPGKDGVRLARELRTKWPGLKVLFMSGNSEEALRLKDVADPAIPLLEKPFSFAGLAKLVEEQLGS